MSRDQEQPHFSGFDRLASSWHPSFPSRETHTRLVEKIASTRIGEVIEVDINGQKTHIMIVDRHK